MRRFHLLLPVALLLCGIPACQQAPTAASVMTGTLKGGVTLFDQNLAPTTDGSGVTVTFEGSGYSTTTDSTGLWTMDGLPTGTYDITYSRQGYGSIRQFGFPFVGGGTEYMTGWHWVLVPTTQVTISSIDPVLAEERLQLSITPTVTATQQVHSPVFIMISRSASSSIDNRTGAWTYENDIAVNSASTLNLSFDEIRSAYGFQSGDTLYIKVYAVAGRYNDPNSRQLEYPSYSSPATETFVVP
jgi:hypothetical protein